MAKGTKRLRDYETTDNRQVKAKSKSPTPKAFAIRQVVAALVASAGLEDQALGTSASTMGETPARFARLLCKNRHKECPSGVE
jgi:hypothetical protein